MANLSGVNKYFSVAKEGFVTTTSAPVASGATTVQLTSVAGYSNGDTVVLVIDAGDVNKKQAFTGVVDTGGLQITNVVWTEGANTSHILGAPVIDYVTASHQSMTTKGLLVSHDQDGTLKTDSVDSTQIKADAITTPKLADGAVTPEKLITGTGTSWAWQSWTPTLTGASTNPTLGTNSVAEGRYTQIGKTVICQINIKFGTSGTNAGSGTYYISLPVAAKTALSEYQSLPIGFLRAQDTSAFNGAVFFPEVETSTTAQLVYYQGIGGTAPASGVTHNTPWAWSTSDLVCAGTITYEAA